MPSHSWDQGWRRVVWVLALQSLATAALLGASALQLVAQTSGGHAEHHPGTTSDTPGVPTPAGPATAPSNPPAVVPGTQPPMPGMESGGAGLAAGGMGGMMGEMMGGRPRKEFYPSLMALPAPSPEQRQSIEAQARARISAGITEIENAENALREANAAGDGAGAEQAASRLRDALNQVSSGTTALRSLAEGKPPPQVAQDWFKGQLNLAPAASTHVSAGPLGLSWFHLLTMSLVTAFATAMLAIYLARMRRAKALVQRLTSAAPVPRAPSAPAPAAAAPVMPASPRLATVPANNVAAVLSATAAELQPAPLAPAPATGGLWKGQLRVAAIFRETPLVKTFRLRDPQGGPIPFSFLPGQFLTYSAEIEGKLVRRSSHSTGTVWVTVAAKEKPPTNAGNAGCCPSLRKKVIARSPRTCPIKGPPQSSRQARRALVLRIRPRRRAPPTRREPGAPPRWRGPHRRTRPSPQP